MKLWIIYENFPTKNKNEKRVVEVFETKEDAQIVFDALESVNKSFNCYTIEEGLEKEK